MHLEPDEPDYATHVDAVAAWFVDRSGRPQADPAIAELGERFRSLANGLTDLPSDGPLGRRERLSRVSRSLDRTRVLSAASYGMPDFILLRALLADPYEEVPDDRAVAQRAACMWLTGDTRLAVFQALCAMTTPEPTVPGLGADLVPVDQIAPQVVLRWLVIASGDSQWDRDLDEALLSDAKFSAVVEQPLRAFFARHPAVLPQDLV